MKMVGIEMCLQREKDCKYNGRNNCEHFIALTCRPCIGIQNDILHKCSLKIQISQNGEHYLALEKKSAININVILTYISIPNAFEMVGFKLFQIICCEITLARCNSQTFFVRNQMLFLIYRHTIYDNRHTIISL